LPLSTPDLVLLSLLAERPMHGYDANLQLELRMVREWAGVSRAQVYYSLEKLSRLKLIRAAESEGPFRGPERRVCETTALGRKALADALEREEWATQQPRSEFLTWLALSWLARPGTFEKQLHRRRAFLESELERKRRTLREVLREVGHQFHEAVWMLTLTIEQVRVELRWLDKLERELEYRAPARNPEYVKGGIR
jgi:DNA-binding PadR family transcriptional regulator